MQSQVSKSHTTVLACREACKLDPKYITNFGEEVVRGQPVFVLSILLQKLEPMLREAAGVAPWQVSCQTLSCCPSCFCDACSADSMVQGQLVFVLGILLQKLEPN